MLSSLFCQKFNYRNFAENNLKKFNLFKNSSQISGHLKLVSIFGIRFVNESNLTTETTE